ncbi:hypothetical protein [Burkholderia cenocepacia]|uniref:hypothetical protein n=1 Tax=Burkholderia cenocepacia TaxID=95486 RepID=UPI000489A79F|nr:hypothetical protein [Burkholderia cenocepacia]
MDEREMLTDDQIFDWLSEIADEEIMASNRASIIEVGRRIEQAGRRTTPDREAIIEECAKVCEDVAARRSVVEMAVGATMCADVIRKLKTAPTSDKGGA